MEKIIIETEMDIEIGKGGIGETKTKEHCVQMCLYEKGEIDRWKERERQREKRDILRLYCLVG